MDVPKTDAPENSFPLGLLSWSGQYVGGVRKPFRDESGRPAGDIRTPLIERLELWVTDLAAGAGLAPRIVLLVGGPGNGKSDAVERCIHAIDKELNADGKLVSHFANKFDVGGSEFVPRRIEVTWKQLGIKIPAHLGAGISLVQDASETSSNEPAEAMFLNEVSELLSGSNDGVYLCCINRGILANASMLARSEGRLPEYRLIEAITGGVTSSSKPLECWPLKGYENFAVWPMDIESLVEQSEGSKDTIGHLIFREALDAEKWRQPCENADLCPFCENRRLLSERENLDGLISILRFYELASGKRWTFRDLFSLVPYLLVGDKSEFKIKDKVLTPCDWTRRQLAQQESDRDSLEQASAIYRMAARLYYHRLFPIWPTFNKDKYFNAKRALFEDRSKSLTTGVKEAKDLFRYLAHVRTYVEMAGGDVPSRIRGNFSDLLDPATADDSAVLFFRDKKKKTVEDLECQFSLSVAAGFRHVGNSRLTKLERRVFGKLVLADEALVEDNFAKKHWAQVEHLQKAVRQIAARFAKRSLCVRQGITSEHRYLQRYGEVSHSKQALNDVRKQLAQLLHENKDSFSAGLATTFGQPLATRDRDVSLVTKKWIDVRVSAPQNDSARPISSLRFLNVEGFDIPLTFQLYRALLKMAEGMHEASLGAEIFTLLDRVKALVSGNLVRNQEVLDQDPYIRIGANRKIEIDHESYAFGTPK